MKVGMGVNLSFLPLVGGLRQRPNFDYSGDHLSVEVAYSFFAIIGRDP